MLEYGRIPNFSAGPSMLPVEVLKQCAEDMLNYKGSGMSVMEMSHRSSIFDQIHNEAIALFREIMNIPDNYKVLFMQGGATLQFAAVPLNLTKNGRADYVATGNFATLAAKEAEKFTTVNIAASSADTKFDRIPTQEELKLDPEADYVHICMNNTIFGTRYPYIPETGEVPLVADISSCILSEPIDVTKFGVLYAGVQKNIAPAGMAVIIIREDLIFAAPDRMPAMLNYQLMAQNNSLYNTPNCWSIYVTKLVLEYIRNTGGLVAMKERNERKAALLYDYFETSKLFKNPVEKNSRSIMNVIFSTDNQALNEKFITEATARGFANLRGHKVLGGMRASIYNNMPEEGVRALVEFLAEFEAKNS